MAMAKTGRPRFFSPDEEEGRTRRRELLAMLRLGESRKSAAKYLGCGTSTITRETSHDPAFCDLVKKAEMMMKKTCLAIILKDPSWQSKAWLLERKWWQEFGQRRMLVGEPEAKTEPIKIEFVGDKVGNVPISEM